VDAQTSVITTIAGTGQAGFGGDGGAADRALFNFVMCITLNPAGDRMHIADLKNRRIRVLELSTGIVSTVAGNGEKAVPADDSSALQSPLLDPRAVAADSKGQVYILERNGHALRVVLTDGTIRTVLGTGEKGFRDGPALEAQMTSPKHICVDEQDNVYIADEGNQAIRKYSPVSHTVETVLGRGHGDPRVQLSQPHGVCWQDGVLFVVDTGHNRILSLR
jgi:sugar lactone lactonase YvrE